MVPPMPSAALDATLAAPGPAPGLSVPPASRAARATLGPRTVLPELELAGGEPRLVSPERPRFEELKLLGEGGMGEVALVKDADIGRTVAVKRLRPELQGPVAVARFADEVRTVGSLEHPNIVPIHDVGRDEAGRYYFVMRHVRGETLEQVIERLAAGDPAYVSRFSVEVRIEIFLGILHALSYAHQQGVLHRDIKPANVMVGRHGEVMLMDWGIGKRVGFRDLAVEADPQGGEPRRLETAVGALVGTPDYMSPEQARGENDTLDRRTDLYSATVLFHELLSLRHLHADRKTLEETLEAVRTLEVSPSALVASMPAEWAHYIAKGLRIDRHARFQSAEEMIERIQKTLDGDVPVECPVTLTKRATREAGRFVDRHPMLAPLAFALTVVVLLLGVVALGLRLGA
jgi:serine/threonine protein kinase